MLPGPLEYLRRGASGEYVRVVQRIINLHLPAGSELLAPDGIFGPLTEAAVKGFQSRYGLVPDGIVGPLTRAKLFPLGAFQSLCYVASPAQPTVERGPARLNFALTGNLPGQIRPPVAVPPTSPPATPQPAVVSPSSVTFPLPPMPLGTGVDIGHIPGLPDPLPFPDLIPQLPSVQFPSLLPLLPPLTLPEFFPKKVQLVAGVQRAVPRLTLLGPPPKSNPVIDTFPFTVRGVWPVAAGGQVQAGGTLGLPINQPISDPKNTTYQVFVQGLSSDLLIAYGSWVHLFILGKASVTVPKDGSSAGVAVSPQFKASFDLTKDGNLSFSVVGGPQLGATAQGGHLTLSLIPFVTTFGVTLTLPDLPRF